ncbi:MAG: SIS domain-containing protein [Clostridia bacterium]|nr:SIS domain-containing protein [Clostridia bacterium]MBQ4573753.1 SIS domain-containing protein [Clostridia bacterium]
MNAINRYITEIERLVAAIRDNQGDMMERAAALSADALCSEGFLFTFGTGHSHILAEEIFYRAGGLARVCPILEDALMLHRNAARSSMFERAPGLAKLLLDDIDALKYGGVLFLFSNSGCNTVAIDMAQEAKARGLSTVCITNITHSEKMTSRHPEGLKLKDVCDIVIDNMGCYGDAALEIGGMMTGATSTVIGAMIMEAVVSRAIEICCERGTPPEVFHSANTKGGDEANADYIEKYKPLVKAI